MARMPHYACTPGGRVREWVTDWRTSSSRIHLRVNVRPRARTRLFCRVLGARVQRIGRVRSWTRCVLWQSRVVGFHSRAAPGGEHKFRLEGAGKSGDGSGGTRYSGYLIVIEYCKLEKRFRYRILDGYAKRLKRTSYSRAGVATNEITVVWSFSQVL